MRTAGLFLEEMFETVAADSGRAHREHVCMFCRSRNPEDVGKPRSEVQMQLFPRVAELAGAPASSATRGNSCIWTSERGLPTSSGLRLRQNMHTCSRCARPESAATVSNISSRKSPAVRIRRRRSPAVSPGVPTQLTQRVFANKAGNDRSGIQETDSSPARAGPPRLSDIGAGRDDDPRGEDAGGRQWVQVRIGTTARPAPTPHDSVSPAAHAVAVTPAARHHAASLTAPGRRRQRTPSRPDPPVHSLPRTRN